MIKSPRYDPSLLQAHSIGWLSVRLVGARHIRLSCSIRMCHLCDKKCSSVTVRLIISTNIFEEYFQPPKNCPDDPHAWKIPSIWNQTDKVDRLCRPTPIVKRLKSKAAATVSYGDSVWLIVAVIAFKFIFK